MRESFYVVYFTFFKRNTVSISGLDFFIKQNLIKHFYHTTFAFFNNHRYIFKCKNIIVSFEKLSTINIRK